MKFIKLREELDFILMKHDVHSTYGYKIKAKLRATHFITRPLEDLMLLLLLKLRKYVFLGFKSKTSMFMFSRIKKKIINYRVLDLNFIILI